jgi:hypothetical protein
MACIHRVVGQFDVFDIFDMKHWKRLGPVIGRADNRRMNSRLAVARGAVERVAAIDSADRIRRVSSAARVRRERERYRS